MHFDPEQQRSRFVRAFSCEDNQGANKIDAFYDFARMCDPDAISSELVRSNRITWNEPIVCEAKRAR